MKEYLWCTSEMILTGGERRTVRETCPSTQRFMEKFYKI